VPDVLEGLHIAGCRIESVAGRGGMGIVYRATQLSLARPVALKLIAPQFAADAGFRERFERESRMAAAIDHPNVIPVYAAGEEDGRLYLVMRWVAGTDLHRLLRERERLEPLRAAGIVHQVAGALDAAHAAGLVHRDVKPANVLLSGEHAYLADFGLTRMAGSDTHLTTGGQFLGTVDYMAPEQFRDGAVDARADVYALGCVLYAALTGRPPFPRETVPATMLAHLHDAPARPSATPGVPEEFDRVLLRALAKAPEDRYPSAGDLGRAALAAAEGRSVTEAERSVARGAAAPTERRRAAAPANGARPRRWGRAKPASPAPAPAPAPAARGLWSPAPGPPRPASGPAPGTARPAEASPVRRYRSRSRRLWLWPALLAVFAGSAFAIVALNGGDRPPVVPGGPVSELEVRQLADSFAADYAAEADVKIGRLLTSDARRVSTAGDRQEGRKAVVAQYHQQFGSNAITGFDLSEIQADGGPVGREQAHYKVSYNGAPATTGTMTWSVIQDRGRARIAQIVAAPDK
jgi:hypothetical protein